MRIIELKNQYNVLHIMFGNWKDPGSWKVHKHLQVVSIIWFVWLSWIWIIKKIGGLVWADEMFYCRLDRCSFLLYEIIIKSIHTKIPKNELVFWNQNPCSKPSYSCTTCHLLHLSPDEDFLDAAGQDKAAAATPKKSPGEHAATSSWSDQKIQQNVFRPCPVSFFPLWCRIR